MSKLVFKPNLQKRRSYSVEPDHQNLRRGLDIILGLFDVEKARGYALKRKEFYIKPVHEGIHYHVLQVRYSPTLRLGQQALTVRETKYLDVLNAVLKAYRLETLRGEHV